MLDYIQFTLQIITSILMIIDTAQTYRIFNINSRAEANIILRGVFYISGIYGVLIFKLIIACTPFIADWYTIGLMVIYAYVVYHNYTGLRDYDNSEENHCVH